MRSLVRKPAKASEGTADQTDDAFLVLAAQADAVAFDRIYERYESPILNYCYYRLGSWSDAEDAAQQIFTNAFAGLDRFRSTGSEASFRSWLFTIAHHEIANRYRHRGRHRDAPLTEAGDYSASDPSPEELAVSADSQRRMLEHLTRLTDDQRRVIELRLAGFTDIEIGEVLGRSPGAVRALQFRAISHLRELMNVRLSEKEGGDV